jgi:glycosyltransferase involved in cell wall biosynthesis
VPRERIGELREELGIPSDAPVVGMVSNLNRSVKGVAWFVDVVPDILDAVPSTHFVVVGGCPDAAALRREVRSRGLDDRRHLPGYREDVHRFSELMDLSVLPSRSAGLSITLLESMGHGLPVVATRVGGNPEVVVDGETGYLVPPGDAGAFVERIEELLSDEALRLELGRAARRRARVEFRVKRAANEYLENYESVLGERHDPRHA